MKKIYYLIRSYLKTPKNWYKNIIWRFPKTISNTENIFVMGTPRSGTTLLQKILEAHSALFSIQSETAIFSYQNYFDPDKLHFVLQKKDVNFLLKSATDNVDFFSKAVELLMQENENKIFIEKTPQHVIHLKFLLKHFPNAKFVHIVRDGRDCYCSARLHPWIPQSKSLKSFAKYYKKCLNPVIEADKDSRVKTIKYENLVKNPEKEITQLMIFLGLQFEPSQLSISKIKDDKRAKLKQFEKLNQKIDNKSVARWRKEISEKENNLFVKIAGDQLRFFGFPLK